MHHSKTPRCWTAARGHGHSLGEQHRPYANARGWVCLRQNESPTPKGARGARSCAAHRLFCRSAPNEFRSPFGTREPPLLPGCSHLPTVVWLKGSDSARFPLGQ